MPASAPADTFDPLQAFRAEAQARLEAALESLHPGTEPRFAWGEAPAGQGDTAAGCFPLAQTLKQGPPQIAAALAERVNAELEGVADAGWVERAEAAGPYVNLHLRSARLMHELVARTHAQGERFADGAPKPGKVMLEHTSANPNGPLHVGRARNPIIGDTLARLFRAAGYDTEVQYYVDDMGKQVAILTWGLETLSEADVEALIGPALQDKIDHKLVRYYQAANQRMEADPEVAAAIQALIHATENGDADALDRVEKGYRDVFEGMLQTLGRLGAHYDSFVKESRFVANGDTERVIDRLASQTEVPVGREGEALYLDLESKGVTGRSTKFFFRRSDGTSLYATRDVAYHAWKSEQSDRMVNVLGEDHKLQAKQVRICMELLDEPTLPEVVFYAFVALPEGKMSTRRNRVVYIDDLLDEAVTRAYEEVRKRRGDELDEAQMRDIAEIVGVGAVRFTIAKVQCEKKITFKWDEALSFDGFTAPFVQYAHARVSGILDKAHGAGLDPDPSAAALLTHPSEAALARTIARLPGTIQLAADRFRPHDVPILAYDIALAFNAFYRDCHVVEPEKPELSRARLALVEAARVALAKSLDLLGIMAPREM